MPVCQFFLEGRCRFGQNCRNEHSYDADDRNNRAVANTQQLKNIVREIVCEVLIAEKGGQWPLSCFSPAKEGPNVPGWEDYSPEEIRWKMYEARRNGTLNQCIKEVNQLYSDAEKRRNALKQPTMKEVGVIVNILKGKQVSSVISNPFASSVTTNNSTSIFGGSSTSAGNQSIFGGSAQTSGNLFGGGIQTGSSIFGGSTQTGGNIFGASPQASGNQGNIFGGNTTSFPNQSVFGGTNTSETQNIFSSSQTHSQNIFSNSPSVLGQNQNIFSKTQPMLDGSNLNTNLSGFASPAGPPIFATQSMLFQPSDKTNQSQGSIFGGNQTDIFRNQNSFIQGNDASIFGSSKASPVRSHTQSSFTTNNLGNNQVTVVDHSAYSKKEDLDADEIEAFMAATFKFGKIPLKPPPLENCK
ncbi:hypothetical protein RUM44_010294 [Polyplax serrata]|uniref:Nucleoporin NUP42 n=1 Tax=Polyplax serrata TaxID=468196 RepID=A0ABR1AV74_POLSC